MKKLIIISFLFNCIFVCSQTKFIALDTISSNFFNKSLIEEFTLKHDLFNKKIDGFNSKKIKVVKKIYFENQKEFIENIHNNNFISDEKTNDYLKELLDEVLSKNNIDKKDYRILLSKDSDFNAHNIGDGTIVINYGLFLIVENEDELVFVISHEIGHQYLNHVKSEIETFAELSTSDEIIKKTNEIRKQKYNKATLANDLLKNIKYQNYSLRRKKEIAADSIGYNFYKRTQRNAKYAISLLSKLDKSDIEKDSLTINDYKLIFEKDEFKLKLKYFESEASVFQKYDFNNNFNTDSLKTHPACNVRIQLLNKKENNQSDGYKRSPFFDLIKSNCVFQNLINLYSKKEFGLCLYESLKCYIKDKNNINLNEIISLSLNEIYKSKSNYTINRYIPTTDKKNNSQSLNRFIDFINNIKITDLEIVINQFKQKI